MGVIDTIFGEENDSYVKNLNLEISIDNSHDKIHSYKNIFSYFDQNRYLTTIDIQKNNFLINKLDLSQVKFSN